MENFENQSVRNTFSIHEAVSEILSLHDFKLASFQKVKVDVGLSFNAPMIRNWISNEKNLLAFGFEPSPKNFQSLMSLQGVTKVSERMIVLRNGSSLAFMINVGLSSNSYSPNMVLFETIKDSGASSLHRPISFEYSSATPSITVWALDEFLLTLMQDTDFFIDHIKIDTQGHDYMVIKGAGQVLKRTFFITAEISVGSDYEVDSADVSNLLELLNILGFAKISYFSARKLIGRLLRLRYLNMVFDRIKKVLHSEKGFTLLEVSDKPFALMRPYFSTHSWIKFTDSTFVNVLLIKAHPKKTFRIFQRG